MNDIKVSKLEKEPVVRFSNENVVLPAPEQSKIDEYWQSLIDSGKQYTRGEVFTVTRVEEQNSVLNVLVEKTDYAHYLYCQNVDAELNGYGIKVIFTACLVETSDNKTIFGQMGEHTARAGIYQLAGGGIDNSDLKDGVFDLQTNISKELKEELNIDVVGGKRVSDFSVAYLKQGGETHKTAVVYKVNLNETSQDFLHKYNEFAKELKNKEEDPEFGNIVVLEQSANEINLFFDKNKEQCDEYMEPLLKHVY
ncbi:MAG: hypothetical protein ABFQ53_00360 [Patescibacteria group bacterium]